MEAGREKESSMGGLLKKERYASFFVCLFLHGSIILMFHFTFPQLPSGVSS